MTCMLTSLAVIYVDVVVVFYRRPVDVRLIDHFLRRLLEKKINKIQFKEEWMLISANKEEPTQFYLCTHFFIFKGTFSQLL